MATNPYQAMDPASFPDPDAPDAEYQGVNTGLSAAQAKSPAGLRYTSAQSALNNLRSQYAEVEQAQGSAYGEQRKIIDNAIANLQSMSLGPSPAEKIAALGQAAVAPLNGQGNAGAIYNENDALGKIAAADRAAQLQKMQLLQNYGQQGVAALIGGTNSQLGKLTQQMRIAQTDVNSAATQLGKQEAQTSKNANSAITIGPDGQPVVNQAYVNAAQQKAAAQQAGKMLGLTGDGFHDTMVAGSTPTSGDPTKNPLYQSFGIQAETYLTTGKAPPGISRNPAMSIAFYRLVSQIAQQRGLQPQAIAAMQAANNAQISSLGKLQSTYNNVEAFENTARENIASLQPLISKVGNGGVPLFNSWRQAVANKTGFGPKQGDLAQFNGYITDIVDEYAKIMSSANASGGTTSDAARTQAMQLLNNAMTPEGFQGAINFLLTSMNNRTRSYQQSLDQIRRSIGTGGAASPQVAPQGAPQGAPQATPKYSPAEAAVLKKYGVNVP